MRATLLGIMSVVVMLGGLVSAGEYRVKDVSAREAQQLLESDKSVQVIDVRTLEEFKDGHIAGAVCVDVMDDGFEAKLAQLDKGKVYLVHCRSGARSRRALKVFKKLGFGEVYHLHQGMEGWQQQGLPKVQP